MTDTTDRLALPLLAAAQAQKHITHNEALLLLDRLVHLTALDRRDAPPGAPSVGDVHLVEAGATGAFSGHDGEIARFGDDAWQFDSPAAGWLLWLSGEDAALVFDGSHWHDLKPRSADRLGISATADATNRLAVASPAILFGHAGDDARVKVNKAAPADTASLVFQTGWSGRAEIGLAGSDDLSVKVSADGSAWKTAARIDRATGFLGLGSAAPSAPLAMVTDGTGLAAGQAAIVVQGGTGAERAEFRSITNAGANAAFQGYGARGTLASPAPTQDGDRLFAVLASGYDGAAFIVPLAAQIDMVAKGTWSTGSHGAAIVFRTTPAGATTASRAERLRILDNGNVRIGADGAATCRLDVDGPVRVKAYPVAGVPAAAASGAGAIVLVSDETGGPVLAFSDGTDWRRVTDRAVVA